MIFGLFAKTVMADSIFAPMVEQVYAQPELHSAIDFWAAVLGFSGQIYFDFSGYSLCAIGLALCFGYYFPQNFNYPYAARSFAEFWRRWHITLWALAARLSTPFHSAEADTGSSKRTGIFS